MSRSDSPGRGPVSPPAHTVPDAVRRKSRRTLLVMLAMCVAPVIASYFTYYVIKPKGGVTNYGQLVEPQRPIPANLSGRDEKGQPVRLADFKGKWLLVSADASSCDKACVTKLFFMRQVRASQGVERERIVAVWLRLDDQPVDAKLNVAYPETRMLIVPSAQLAGWLPAGPDGAMTSEIYLIDPNGNLMMRFPGNGDPTRMNKDLAKLLKWSAIG